MGREPVVREYRVRGPRLRGVLNHNHRDIILFQKADHPVKLLYRPLPDVFCSDIILKAVTGSRLLIETKADRPHHQQFSDTFHSS